LGSYHRSTIDLLGKIKTPKYQSFIIHYFTLATTW
jgi:hypothetical protein